MKIPIEKSKYKLHAAYTVLISLDFLGPAPARHKPSPTPPSPSPLPLLPPLVQHENT